MRPVPGMIPSFLSRHTPGLASAIVLSLLVLLVLCAYARDLKRAMQAPLLNAPHLSAIVQAYHNRPNAPGIAHTLSHLLTDHPIKRPVFAFLLSHAEQRLPTYLHRAPLGPVRGFAQGATHVFGLSHRDLTTGEILLLCDLSTTGAAPQSDPLRALKRRDALLAELHSLGVLTETEYRAERARALSLPPDHRPVY